MGRGRDDRARGLEVGRVHFAGVEGAAGEAQRPRRAGGAVRARWAGRVQARGEGQARPGARDSEGRPSAASRRVEGGGGAVRVRE
jgi:hypothetical protein